MGDELPDVPALRVLEPPPNGLALLRAKLDVPERRWWLVLVPVALAAAATLAWFVLRPTPHAPRVEVATRAPLAEPAVVGATFYWVSSSPHSEPRTVPTSVSILDAPRVEVVTP